MQATTDLGATIGPITITPYNSAANSKGSIHDDDKAREMGYRGGFVPGVTVLGYMTRLLHVAFGAAALSDFQFRGRLRRPVYEGADVTVDGTVTGRSTEDGVERVSVEMRVVTAEGEVAAIGSATCRVDGHE
jgi:hypothetical protein